MSIAQNFPNLKPSLMLSFADTRQLDNRVTFTRSTPAVYYDGRTTTMAEQNLLLQSQTFDVSPWTVANTSVTANATTAPDGTTTADRIFEDSANSAHAIYQALGTTSGSCTFSVYAKADTRSWLNINAYVAGVRNNWFDLTNGVTGTVASGCTATITSVGNGWYRCAVTTTGGSPTYFECWLATGNNVTTYAGDGTSGLYLWGAQFEARSSATAYTATTTQPITNYIPVLLTAGGNQPRFDCNPTTGESLGLLIEEQRTNLALYSSDFSNAAWSKFRSSVSSNVIIAPDGTLTGDKLVEDSTASNTHFVLQNISLGGSVDSSTYTVSIYAKAGERTRLQMFDNNSVSSGVSIFDLSTGTVVSGTGKITSVGNGWYRCSIYPLKDYTTSSTAYVILDNGSTTSYTGNGFSGLFIWGFQLETASFATSYIATTSASATRTVDSAVMTGTNFSSWANSSAFTVFTKVSRFANALPSQESIWSISQSSPAQVVSGLITTSPAYRAYFESAADMSVSYPNLANVQYSVIQAYQTDNFAACANGGTVSTDNSGAMNIVSGFDTLYLGRFTSPQNQFNGYISKFAYYPLRLSNTNLQALTS